MIVVFYYMFFFSALLISEAISNHGSSSSNVKLSQILRLFYGDHGLFWGDVKACNRLKLSNIIGKEEILENVSISKNNELIYPANKGIR